MVSLAQRMRSKKRLKVDEFLIGFEAFLIWFNVKIFLENAEFLNKFKKGKKLKRWKVKKHKAERA